MFYALIIGNDVYDEKDFANLSGATRDARKLSDFIQSRFSSADCYGPGQVKITLLTNPTSWEVRSAFSEIVNLLDDESTFFFYFSGHGLCLNGEDRPSLLCRDAMEALLDGAVGAGEIAPRFITSMSRRGRGNMFFCFDVCRSAVFTGHGVPSPLRMKGLCRDATSKKGRDADSGNRCALTSCRDRELASDDGSFVDAIIAEWDASLASRRGVFIGWTFVKRVSNRLRAKRLRQRPEMSGTPFALTPGAEESVVESHRDDVQPGRSARVPSALALVALAALVALSLFIFAPKKDPPTDPGGNEFPVVGGGEVADARPSERLLSGWDAFNAGDLPGAARIASEALEKDSRDVGAQELLSRVRAKECEVLLNENGDLEEAASKILEALTLDANCKGAASLRDAIRKSLVDDAETELNDRNYARSKTLAEKALDLVPSDVRATYVRTQSEKGLKEAERVAALVQEGEKTLAAARSEESFEKARDALSKSEEASSSQAIDPSGEIATRAKSLGSQANKLIFNLEVSALVKEGWDALSSGDAPLARNKANEALRKDPENAKARELLTSSNRANAKRLALEGESLRRSGSLDEAETKAKAALADEPGCQEAKDLQTRIAADRKQARIATLLKDGAEAVKKSDFESAKLKANAVLALDSKNTEARKLLEETVKKENSWGESSSRKAGTRQTLKIGNAEYGFCWIPAGEFDMGSPLSEKDRYSNEKLHHVKLTKGFWALETETPQALYQEVMGTNPSGFKGDDLPVETVSWNEAMEFCAELTKRLPKGLKATLPTESQWEYACRAGTTTPYSFGSALNGDKANCDGSRPYGTTAKGEFVKKTTPAKTYAPNDWGLYDMHGNVCEWCLDYYDKDYPTGTVTDPKGPVSASYRVFRGGGWGRYARGCRSANRDWFSADFRGNYLGFRFLLVCD